jgi:hypothetical protein
VRRWGLCHGITLVLIIIPSNHCRVIYFLSQKSKYTGRENGTKRSWTHAGKVAFNDYMLKACQTGINMGRDLTQGYRHSGKASKDDKMQPSSKRVVTHSNLTIQELVAQCDTCSPGASVPEPEEEDDDKMLDLDIVMIEV